MTYGSVLLAGRHLANPLMNGAGSCKTIEDVRKLVRSSVSAIVVGSVTKLARGGNAGNVFWVGNNYTLNSLGLPNGGKEYYLEHLPEMAAIANSAEKLLIVSIAGFTPEEYAELAEMAWLCGADIVELNLGCPNVWDGGVQKRIACFDPKVVDEILRLVGEVAKNLDGIFSVKLSPFSDPVLLGEIAQVITAHHTQIVVATNTFPNAYTLESGLAVITPANGLAGLAGRALFPISLGQVQQLRALMPEVQLIGVGGIASGQDMLDYLSVCTAVQVTSHYLASGENVSVFTQILTQYAGLVSD